MRSKKEDAQKRKKESNPSHVRRLERPKDGFETFAREAHKDGRTDGEDDDEAEERHALRHDVVVGVVGVGVGVVEQWYYNTSLCPRAR